MKDQYQRENLLTSTVISFQTLRRISWSNKFFKNKIKRLNHAKSIYEIFCVFDSNFKGSITYVEFSSLLQSLFALENKSLELVVIKTLFGKLGGSRNTVRILPEHFFKYCGKHECDLKEFMKLMKSLIEVPNPEISFCSCCSLPF